MTWPDNRHWANLGSSRNLHFGSRNLGGSRGCHLEGSSRLGRKRNLSLGNRWLSHTNNFCGRSSVNTFGGCRHDSMKLVYCYLFAIGKGMEGRYR